MSSVKGMVEMSCETPEWPGWGVMSSQAWIGAPVGSAHTSPAVDSSKNTSTCSGFILLCACWGHEMKINSTRLITSDSAIMRLLIVFLWQAIKSCIILYKYRRLPLVVPPPRKTYLVAHYFSIKVTLYVCLYPNIQIQGYNLHAIVQTTVFSAVRANASRSSEWPRLQI